MRRAIEKRYRDSHPEYRQKVAERVARWKAANRDKVNAQANARYAAKTAGKPRTAPRKHADIARAWRIANAEKARLADKKYRDSHKKNHAARVKKWRSENPGKRFGHLNGSGLLPIRAVLTKARGDGLKPTPRRSAQAASEAKRPGQRKTPRSTRFFASGLMRGGNHAAGAPDHSPSRSGSNFSMIPATNVCAAGLMNPARSIDTRRQDSHSSAG